MKKFFGFIFTVAIIIAVIYGASTLINGGNQTPTVYYTVTFDLGEIAGTTPAAQTVAKDGYAGAPTGISQTGYTLYWVTDPEVPSSKWIFSLSAVTADVTLYALFEINTYSVFYNANGGTGTIASQSGDYNSVKTIASGSGFSKSGHNFTGWNTQANGGGTAYSVGANFTVPAFNTTLYAQWSLVQFNINFNLAGGTGSTPLTQSVTYLDKLTAVAEPTKTNFAFAGWWVGTSEDNYSQEWNFSSDLASSNLTLYAGWATAEFNADYSFLELGNCIKILGYINSTAPSILTIPDSINEKPVLSIAENAFANGNFSFDTEEIILPSTLTTICDEAFYGCLSIQELTIPNSVTSIGLRAFDNCSYMYDLSIGSGVKLIGEQAFYQCTSLCNSTSYTLTIPSNVLIVDAMAFSISTITGAVFNLSLQEGLVKIGNDAFSGNWFLSVNIPNSVQTIGTRAFQSCTYLTKVIIGTGIQTIGVDAFRYTNSTSFYVEMKGTIPPVISSQLVFDYPSGYEEGRNSFWITVPSGSIDAYKEAANWNVYYDPFITQYSFDDIVYPTRP